MAKKAAAKTPKAKAPATKEPAAPVAKPKVAAAKDEPVKPAAKKAAAKKAAATPEAPKPAAKKAAAKKAAATKEPTAKSPTATAKAAAPVAAAQPPVAPASKAPTPKAPAPKAAAKPAPRRAPASSSTPSTSPSAAEDAPAMAPKSKTTTRTTPAAKSAAAPAGKAPASPVAVKTPPRVAAAPPPLATPAPVAPAPIAPSTNLETGSIRPAAKRPAAPTAINASQLYRQERENRLVAQRAPAAPPPALAELPADYGRTRVSVLVRDAEWIFVYWEISDATRAELGLVRGRHGEQLILRHYDVTGLLDFNGNNANSKFDVFVNDHTSSWYVQVPQSGRRYIVELGILRGSRYTAISRSTPIEVPLAMIARDIEWAPGSELDENNVQLLRLSGGGLDLTSRMGSEGFVSELQKRGALFSGALFSGGLMSSSEFSSQSLVARREAAGKDRKFWLVVDAEVIVYGATEPDAKVKFMGRPIRLNPDGTFGVRMALPDGTIEFPVEATSADDVETRWVMPVVNRRTDGSTGS